MIEIGDAFVLSTDQGASFGVVIGVSNPTTPLVLFQSGVLVNLHASLVAVGKQVAYDFEIPLTNGATTPEQGKVGS